METNAANIICKRASVATLTVALLMGTISMPIKAADAETDTPEAQAQKLDRQGNRYYRNYQMKRAERAYLKALEADAKHARSIKSLINLYASQRRFAEAMALVDAGLEIAPGNPYWWLKKGVLHRDTGKQAAAREAFFQAAKMAPTDPAVLRQVEDYLYQQNDLLQAREMGVRRKLLEQNQQAE